MTIDTPVILLNESKPKTVTAEVVAFIKGADGIVTPELQQLADEAQISADAAQNAEQSADASSSAAAASEVGSSAAADRSESAASMSAAASNPFPNTADGLLNTSGSGATNRFFSVPGSGDALTILYRNDAGVAAEIGSSPSALAVEAINQDLAVIADRSVTKYFEGEEVADAVVDVEGRVSEVTLISGVKKIPKLQLSPPALAVMQGMIDTSTADFASIDAIWPTTALGALAQAARRRVDFVMIGDSNQKKDGYGWGGGLMRALHDRFGCYATAISAQSPISVAAYTATGEFNYGVGGAATYQGAPAEVEAVFPGFSFSIEGSPNGIGYAWLADGLTVSSGASGGGVAVDVAHAIGVSNLLRIHYDWVSLASGAGQFQVAARLNGTPFTTIVESPLTLTNTGEYSLHRQTLDIPAAVRTRGLECKWFIQNSEVLTGPFAAAWLRLENPAKLTGVSVSTIYGAGGQSLYDMASYLLTAPIQVLINWFDETRRLQLLSGQKPMVVVYVNSALNDQNETLTPSFGWRASTTPDSATAYLDNLEAIAKRISDVWQKAGWDHEELFFLAMPSHPISNPDADKLLSYRKAAYSFAEGRQRTSFIDMTLVTDADELTANNWYLSAGDHFHLVQAAYTALAARVVNLIPELDA